MSKDEQKRCGVYIFQCLQTDGVKIGLSTNVSERLKTIQANSSTDLLEVVFIPRESPKDLESALHTLFAEYRMHGEWFNPLIQEDNAFKALMILSEIGGVFGKVDNRPFYDRMLVEMLEARDAKK